MEEDQEVPPAKLLIQASADNHVEAVRALLEAGVSANICYQNRSPVCVATDEGHADVVRELLTHGCSADRPDMGDPMWHRQPIHYAAARGHLDIVRLLLQHGIDVNSIDRENRTPLHWAATLGWVPVAEYLMANGAAINIVQKDGFTALHAATCLGNLEMCSFLIANGAEVNRADKDGWSSLHAAVCYGHLPICKLLLQSGARINQRTNEDESVLHIAGEKCRLDILEFLIQAGADPEVTNIHGFTPFLDSVWRNKYAVAWQLVDQGVNVMTTNKAGHSALWVATVRYEQRFIKLILAAGCDLRQEEWLHRDLRVISTLADRRQLVLRFRQMLSNVQPLQTLCYLAVRRSLGRCITQKVQHLPVPRSIRSLISLDFVRPTEGDGTDPDPDPAPSTSTAGFEESTESQKEVPNAD
jgi:ankyrin repeat protein